MSNNFIKFYIRNPTKLENTKPIMTLWSFDFQKKFQNNCDTALFSEM